MKFLWEGLIRRAESKDKIPLQGTDKECSVERLKGRMNFLCGGLIRNVMLRDESNHEIPLRGTE